MWVRGMQGEEKHYLLTIHSIDLGTGVMGLEKVENEIHGEYGKLVANGGMLHCNTRKVALGNVYYCSSPARTD